MEKENRYRIETVHQAGQVLKTVANSKEPMGAIAIAKSLDIKSNTAFRICQTLDEIGFLKQVGDRYELGMGLALFWARKKASLETKREAVESDLDSIQIKENEHGE